MKKLIIILTISLVAAALAIGLVACNGTDDGGVKDGSVNGGFQDMDTAEEIYGFSAASAGMLISAMNDGGAAAAMAQSAASDVPEETPSTDPVTEQLDGYMALVESLLSDGGFTVTTGESDDPDYKVKSVITYRDMQGGPHSYTMYYNEELRPDYDDDDDPYEVEEEYSIRGIMIIDGKSYEIYGERSFESEPGEREDETEFIVYLSDTRRMVVEQSVETEDGEYEKEFSYLIYEGQRVIERSTFEYEEERGELEIEMTFVDQTGASSVFFFDREQLRNGEEVIRIRVGSMQSSEGYYVRITDNGDGTHSYTYEAMRRG